MVHTVSRVSLQGAYVYTTPVRTPTPTILGSHLLGPVITFTWILRFHFWKPNPRWGCMGSRETSGQCVVPHLPSWPTTLAEILEKNTDEALDGLQRRPSGCRKASQHKAGQFSCRWPMGGTECCGSHLGTTFWRPKRPQVEGSAEHGLSPSHGVLAGRRHPQESTTELGKEVGTPALVYACSSIQNQAKLW